MENKSKIDHTSLQHGFFQFTFPHTWKAIVAWVIAFVMFVAAGLFLMFSLDIPDVPPVSEAISIDNLDEIDEDDEVDLGQGWEGETGTFLTIDVVIEQGVLVDGYWTLDSDGENCTDRVDEYDDAVITVKPISGGDSFTLGWHDKLASEVNTVNRNCPGYEPWSIGEGDVVKLFMVQEDGELSMLSVGAEGLKIGERTDREDAQRVGLAITIVASLIMMFTTPTSMSNDIKKLRERWGNSPFVHGTPGNLQSAIGPIRSTDESDWVLPPPGLETWPDNPYQSNEENVLIEEHPDVVGTPHPATFTLFSINGIVFVITSIWLASDLLARHGDDLHQWAGQALRIVIIIFTLTWTYFAWKKWKLMHNILDTPSSRVRSVAAGAAELVGQVRPAPSGTLDIHVGGYPEFQVQGVVAYRWKEEEYVCTRDNDGNESCSWEPRRRDSGSTRFMLHDGTGGILVEPDTWDEVNLGDQLYTWQSGNWRWTVWVLAAGDPVYCLGRVEIRDNADKEEGLDGTIPNSHLVVRGNKDIGMQVHLHRGTEISLLSNLRSTTESIIMPLIMLTFSAIPFIW